MLVPSPTQAVAVLTWLQTVLNLDDTGEAMDPEPFPDGSVFPGERDHPRLARWARINTVALVGRGLVRTHEASDVGEDEQALIERRAEHREWTCSITVCSRLNPTARVLSDSAGIHLQRALGAFEGVHAAPLALVGVAPLRRADMQDVSRITGTTEWETRAAAVVTWLCGWTATTSVGWLERVTGTGQVSESTPLAFDSDQGA